MLEVSRLLKHGGPLTKSMSLDDAGHLISDGSACVMATGEAWRLVCPDLAAFAAEIAVLGPSDAIALGALHDDLPDVVTITTKAQLDKLNGTSPPDMIARTGDFIAYRDGRPALALIDIDSKGMPSTVQAAIEAAGGYARALALVLPELAGTGRVVRRSTTTGIFRSDTGEKLPGSNGLHIFVLVQDGADVERFLRTLHARCWLAGFGWLMVGAGGQLLERSIVDRMVFAPERLVFEGAPVLQPPLQQSLNQRRPVLYDGPPLDTRSACLPLSIVEQAKLKELRVKEAVRLKLPVQKARAAFVHDHGSRIAARTGLPLAQAEGIARQQTTGILLPDVVLPFDDTALAGTTVGDVLANPPQYIGATLADPLEGMDYGACKAKVMLWPNGIPWIHSFAHGRTIYALKYDAKAVRALIEAAPDDAVAGIFTAAMQNAAIEATDAQTLRDVVAARSGVGKRTLDTQIKQRLAEHARTQRAEERERQAAERLDHRPQIPSPLADAPWLPQMDVLNDVLGAAAAREPPMRDIDGAMAQIRLRRVPDMHALMPGVANADSDETRLPAPEQPLLHRLSEVQLAELIERHIDYIDPQGRSVHLNPAFVRHYQTRADDKLPVVAAIATLPLVLGDGSLLTRRGLDRQRGIVFRIPAELLSILPRPEECGETAVAESMRFLTDDWLADVATDYAGKCCMIAAAMTVIERALLPDRPAFFVTSGRRGGGKTTTLTMLLVAATGIRPSAAAWSPNDEERRKALLAYLMEAVPAIVWDNIIRGTQISCPHIEKACTAAFYADRRLGVSELVSVAASSIHFFTGNNINPRGDLASRSLRMRLEVDRADPENRDFVHPDPIGWTEANRGRILRSFYTIMLGNPALRAGSNVIAQTRFKVWWRLVGSSVEHASRCHREHVLAGTMDAPRDIPASVDFRTLFLVQEEDEEEGANLGAALAALLAQKWNQNEFKAADLAAMLNDRSDMRLTEQMERAAWLREFLFPKHVQGQDISAKSVGRMLKHHLGEPVIFEDKTLILNEARASGVGPKGALVYKITVR